MILIVIFILIDWLSARSNSGSSSSSSSTITGGSISGSGSTSNIIAGVTVLAEVIA